MLSFASTIRRAGLNRGFLGGFPFGRFALQWALLAVANFAWTNAAAAAVTLTEALDAPSLTWQTGGNSPWTAQGSVTRVGLEAGESGSITDGQVSWIETMATGPGPVSFWWKVSSELGYDQFQFLIDGVEQANISGEVEWQQRTFQLSDGGHSLRWSYVKDPSDLGGSDRAWLDGIAYTPPADSPPVIRIQPASQSVAAGAFVVLSVTATGIPAPTYQWYFNGDPLPNATNDAHLIAAATTADAGSYWVVVRNSAGSVTSQAATLTVTLIGEAFDALELSWSVGGDASWRGQSQVSHDGVDSGESGAITNSQQCWVQTIISGPGVLSFWWKASSEPFYDGLQFLTNGVVAASLSGDSVWEQKVFSVPTGTHQLRWRYFKDGSLSAGEDRGWLDEVIYAGNRPPSDLGLTLAAPAITEGHAANLTGSFVDPDAGDEHRLTIDWGDGSPEVVAVLPAGVRTFNSTHEYPDDPIPGGPDTNVITVTLSDEAGTAAGEVRLRVNNAAPSITGVAMPPQIYPFDTVQLTASIGDAGLADALRLSVNWGDGTPVQSADYPSGPRAVSFQHRYVLAGTNVIVSLIATDDDNGSTTVTTNLGIRSLPLRVRLQPPQRVAPDTVRLRGQGTAGARYVLEASPDLRRWSAIAVVTPGVGNLFAYDEVERTRAPARFYRAVWESQSPVARFADIWILPGGQVRMKVVGRPSTTYRVERADGLAHWVDFRTVTTDTNGVGLLDETPAPGAARIYRAVEP